MGRSKSLEEGFCNHNFKSPEENEWVNGEKEVISGNGPTKATKSATINNQRQLTTINKQKQTSTGLGEDSIFLTGNSDSEAALQKKKKKVRVNLKPKKKSPSSKKFI